MKFLSKDGRILRNSVTANKFITQKKRPLLNGLIAYWNLDELSGTRYDSHVNALHLNDNNTVTNGLGVDGVSIAANFTDSNLEYLSHPDDDRLEIGAFGMSFGGWFYISGAIASYLGLADKGYAGFSGGGWHLRGNSSQLGFEARNINNDGVNGGYTDGGTLVSGSWMHLLFTYNEVTGETLLYKDGVPIRSYSSTAGGIYSGGTNQLQLGGNNAGTSTFNGRMQCIGYWRRCLSGEEVHWLYNSGSAARKYEDVFQWDGGSPLLVGLDAYWNLDEASGTRYDSHARGLHLTDNNTVGTSFGPDGTSVCASFIKANTEYLSVANNPNLAINDSDWTLCGWIQRNSPTDAYLGFQYNQAQAYWFADAGANMGFGASNGITSPSVAVATRPKWSFIVASYNATTNLLSLSIDNSTPQTVTLNPGPTAPTSSFSIGRSDGWGYFDGLAQKFGVWSRLLTSTEIAFLYNYGIGRTYNEVKNWNGVLVTPPLLNGMVEFWKLSESNKYGSFADMTFTIVNSVGTGLGLRANEASSDFESSSSMSLQRASEPALQPSGTNGLTVAVWAKPESVVSYATLISKSDGTPRQFGLFRDDTSNALYWSVSNESSQSRLLSGAGNMPTGEWTFALAWWDGSEQRLKLSTNCSGVWSYNGCESIHSSGAGTLQLGIGQAGGYYDGLMQDVGYWRRRLEPHERFWLYNNGNGRTWAEMVRWEDKMGTPPLLRDLVEYWELDEASGQRFGSHRGLTLTDNNTVGSGLGVDGSSIAARVIAANSEYLSIADTNDLSIGQSSVSICLWYKPSTLPSYAGILSKGYHGHADGEYAFYGIGNQLVFGGRNITNDGSNGSQVAAFTADSWVFLCFTYNHLTGNVKFYKDGSIVTDETDSVGGFFDGSNSFFIGRMPWGEYADGYYQSFGIFKRVLTNSEVLWLYNNGSRARRYDELINYSL